MKYRKDKYGEPISQLGYGCMRFSRKGGIDYDKAEREVLLAMEKGVNYYDTAYIYPGSEDTLGKILSRNHCRDQVKIATKLPQYYLRTKSSVELTFREQMNRLQTDHIDYYLMHMFTDVLEWEKLQKLDIEEWIAGKKASGEIGQIGFSYHGNSDVFLPILEAYDWDFCQIQYNYMDEVSQAGRIGMEAAAAKGIPVIIMEPLRGGKLVDIPAKAKKELEASGKGWTPAELGLRWLWDQPEVTCVLSGMNSTEMVEENIRIASEAEPGTFTEADRELVDRIRAIIKEKEKVGCTGCRYCMPCPAGVDIPGVFHYYNYLYSGSWLTGRFEYARNVGMQKEPGFASRCIGCGKCEQHCPQHIPIRQMLKKADRTLRTPLWRVAIPVARKVVKR